MRYKMITAASETVTLVGPRKITLRAKAIVAFALLTLYLVLSGAYITHERQKLLDIVQNMERVHTELQSIAKVMTAVTHSIATLGDLLNASGYSTAYDDVSSDIESVEAGLTELKELSAEFAPRFVRFDADLTALKSERTPEKRIALRDSEVVLFMTVDEIQRTRHQQSLYLLTQYRDLYSRITLHSLLLFLLGLGIFGASVASFFTRLSADIKMLESRSTAVVNGYRGAPLPVTRQDEVGGLMRSVNQMQAELLEREQQQEISRQQLFHREKMAAVGALAAAVAHEVNNPINAISGIAQHTVNDIEAGRPPDEQKLCRLARITITQAERIGAIMRQLADFGAPRSPAAELLDINELTKATCSFIRYDRRFRDIELTLELDHGISSVRAVSDHLTQTLMNLLINASDAMNGLTGRRGLIRVLTQRLDGEVVLSVTDNGHGMDAAVQARAFERSFTTKAAGKGRGIGLYLCKTLVEEGGGTIELESAAGSGTMVRVHIPLNKAPPNGVTQT